MKQFILVVILSWFLTVLAFGAAVRLRWDENTETNLAGYQILESNVPGGPYTLVEEIPPNHHEGDTTLPDEDGRDYYRILDLADGVYYWVVTAFDNEIPRNVSVYSNEVGVQIINVIPVPMPPAAPTGLTAIQE